MLANAALSLWVIVGVTAIETPVMASAGCELALVRELERLLVIEARSSDALRKEEAPVTVSLRCEGDEASIALLSEGFVSRRLTRNQLPRNAWARLLALAAIELAERRTVPALRADPATEARVDEPPSSAAPVESNRGAAIPVIRAFAVASVSGPSASLRWGGSGGFVGRVGANWAYFVALSGDLGSLTANDLGRIEVTSLSVSGRFGPAGASEWWGWDAGVGVRAGGVRIEGIPSDSSAVRGERLDAPWVGGLIGATISFRFWKQLRLEAMIEGGWVLTPVVGTAESARVGLAGPWGALGLGIGFGL